MTDRAHDTPEEEARPVLEAIHDPGAPLLVAFGGIRAGLGMPPFEFLRITSTLDVNRVFLRDVAQAWYHRGLGQVAADLGGLEQWLHTLIRRAEASRTVFVGNSMGGYAALLLGRRLGVRRVLAFAPQTYIGRIRRWATRDRRWRNQIASMYAHCGASLPTYDLRQALRTVTSNTPCDVFYDPTDRLDRAHARHVGGLPHVRLHAHDIGGHGLIKHLRDQGRLLPLLADALGITPPPAG